MSSGQWEVVGGKANKKSKVPISKAAKNDKTRMNNANFQLSDPLTESATVYSTLIRDIVEPPKEKKVEKEPLKVQQKNNVQLKKKKPEKKAPAAKLPIEKAFESITVEEVKNHLATLEILYVDTPLMWLKELTSYLNSKLDAIVEDPIFNSKPTGYPFKLLHKGVAKEIIKIIKLCKSQQLDVFFEFSLNALVNCMGKGNHGMGHRTVLQCLGQESPNIIKNNIRKCVEVSNATLNRPPVCLSVLWVVGQAGNKNLDVGFQVWSEVMYPLIGNKNCSSFIVEYLEKLVAQAEGKSHKSLLAVKDFFPLLDLIYCKEFSKGLYQKRMLALFPALKLISYGSEPESNMRHYFPSYLRRLEPQCPEPLREEILKSLLYCLEVDPRCYSIWRQLYTKHFVQSKLLISYIREQWGSLSSRFPRRLLLETLSVFQVTNNELAASKKKDTDLQECIKVTQDLLLHLHKNISKGKRWLLHGLFLFSITCFALLQYDVSKHGSFAESKTGIFMKEYGILAASTQVAEKLKYFYDRVDMLMKQYFPTVQVWCQKTLGPAIESFSRALAAATVSAWDSTQVLRSFCSKNIPPVLQKIDSLAGEYAPQAKTALLNGLTVLTNQLTIALTAITKYSQEAMTSIQSSPFVQQAVAVVSEQASNIVESIGHLVNYAYSVAEKYIPA